MGMLRDISVHYNLIFAHIHLSEYISFKTFRGLSIQQHKYVHNHWYSYFVKSIAYMKSDYTL